MSISLSRMSNKEAKRNKVGGNELAASAQLNQIKKERKALDIE